MKASKILLLFFVAIGLIDSVYLTIVHYTNLPLYCPETTTINCVGVTTSAFSQVAGIPIALGGVIWFAVFGVLVLALPKIKVLRNIWFILAVGAVAYSLVGQGILGEICVYCDLLDLMLALSVIVGLRYSAEIFPS
ncbi:MAG: hypothetical protein KGH94_05085 [Candidatus Micrarchaeota archaeon]|nr:hypothetical protein [Candidatus Micrarchaeota archaeon]